MTHYVTTRRLPPLPPVIQGDTFTHQASRSLWVGSWPGAYQGPDWERSDILSRLQVRNLRVLWADPTVSAVTSWEHSVQCEQCAAAATTRVDSTAGSGYVCDEHIPAGTWIDEE